MINYVLFGSKATFLKRSRKKKATAAFEDPSRYMSEILSLSTGTY